MGMRAAVDRYNPMAWQGASHIGSLQSAVWAAVARAMAVDSKSIDLAQK